MTAVGSEAVVFWLAGSKTGVVWVLIRGRFSMGGSWSLRFSRLLLLVLGAPKLISVCHQTVGFTRWSYLRVRPLVEQQSREESNMGVHISTLASPVHCPLGGLFIGRPRQYGCPLLQEYPLSIGAHCQGAFMFMLPEYIFE